MLITNSSQLVHMWYRRRILIISG